MAPRCAYLVYLWISSKTNAAVLSQYEFSQAGCREGLFEDTAGQGVFFGDLVLNASASCLDGVGIEGGTGSPGWPTVSSTGTNKAFLEALQGPDIFPGFSVELWLSIGNITCAEQDSSGWFLHTCEAPVFAISSSSVLDSSELCRSNTDMEITYIINTRNFQARFNANKNNECVGFGTLEDTLPKETAGYPFHFVLTVREIILSGVDYSFFQWFINGTRVSSFLSFIVDPTSMLAEWHATYEIQLLDKRRWPESTRYKPLEARIYLAALHNETFNNSLALSRISEGIADSTPVVYDSTVSVAEDGEVGDHYEEPEFYLQEIPGVDLHQVPLDVYDADNDLTTPNYKEILPRVFVDTFPFPGLLFDSVGDIIVSTPFEVIGDRGTFSVRYRPLFNDFATENVYANFSFHAEDDKSGSRSFANATVKVRVFSKNDPPVALNASHEVFAGTKQNIISLQGTDVDAEDYVREAVIVEPPNGGSLFQVCSINKSPQSLQLKFHGRQLEL